MNGSSTNSKTIEFIFILINIIDVYCLYIVPCRRYTYIIYSYVPNRHEINEFMILIIFFYKRLKTKIRKFNLFLQ